MGPPSPASPTAPPTPVGCIPWQQEAAHSILSRDHLTTIFSAAQAPTPADAPLVWHSHSLDTIFVVLSAADATNETPAPDGTCVCARISTTPGGVLVYELTGAPPLVHRVRDHARTLAFVGVEVAGGRLEGGARRLGIVGEVAENVARAPFAEAGRIALRRGVATPVGRERGPGVLPVRTVVVAVDGRSRVGELGVSVPPGATVQRHSQTRLGFQFEVLVVSHAPHGTLESDAACVLLNEGKEAWEGIVIDVWGRWAGAEASAEAEAKAEAL